LLCCSLSEIAGVFAAYAKYRCDRGDLFIPLARAIFEDRLKALDGKEFAKVGAEEQSPASVSLNPVAIGDVLGCGCADLLALLHKAADRGPGFRVH
jgi:hypothetical protein